MKKYYVTTVFSVVSAIVLTGCGGDSSSSDGNSNVETDCAVIGIPSAGMQYSFKTTAPQGEVVVGPITFLEVDATKSVTKMNGIPGGIADVGVIPEGMVPESITTEYRTVGDAHFTMSKEMTEIQFNSGGLSGKMVSTTTYSPPAKYPRKMCENDEYGVSYTAVTVSEASGSIAVLLAQSGLGTGDSSTESVDMSFRVEAVNKSITVPAGTFKTVQLTENGISGDGYISGRSWIDIGTGLMVKQELDTDYGKVVMVLQTLTQ